MSTGWDPGGSPRLFCASIGGIGEDAFVSAFMGWVPWPGSSPSPAPPTVALGTGDFSIECWAKRKVGNSPGGDIKFHTGFLADSSNFGFPGASLRWQADDEKVDAVFDATPTGAPGPVQISNIAGTTLGRWNHYCLNADRSGDMEVFVDNVSKGTVDINTNHSGDMGSMDFYPLIAEDPATAAYNRDLDNWTSMEISPVVMGPVAVHNRLMTAAEREASRRGKTVQRFGASVTQLAFNWDVRLETGWDADLAHIFNTFRIGQSVPLLAPTGVSGTVYVRDLSGNENHLLLPVAASYSTTTATKAPFALGAETFFR